MHSIAKPRFSLASLLLLITLSGVSISHWVASRQLRRATQTVKDQQSEIRNLSHRLGILTPEDLPFVQIQRSLRQGETSAYGADHKGVDVLWRIHLPNTEKWRLCWAVQDIPQAGLPIKAAGFKDLPNVTTDWAWLRVSFPYHSILGWSAEFEFGEEEAWSFQIPDERSDWLEPNASTEGECAGPWDHHTRECFIEQFSCDKPIALFRERMCIVKKLGDVDQLVSNPDPCNGFIAWIEPVQNSDARGRLPDSR